MWRQGSVLHDLQSPQEFQLHPHFMSLSCACYSPGNRASSCSLNRPRFSYFGVFSPSVCCCPSSLTLMSPQHSTLTLTRPTYWPRPLSIPALTCLRPVQFQQPRKRSRGGQSGCELEIVLGATGNCCIWSPSTVTSKRKLYNRFVGTSSFPRLPWWLSGEESSCQCRRTDSIPGSAPLEKRMATHSNILTWRIPWTEEPGGLQSMGLQRVRHD